VENTISAKSREDLF